MIGEVGIFDSIGASAQKHHFLVQTYKILDVITRQMAPFLSKSISIIMCLGSSLIILLDFATIKMYRVIPMPLYFFFPTVGITAKIILHTLLPQIIWIREQSYQVLERIRNQAVDIKSGPARKEFLMELKHLRPAPIYVSFANYNFVALKNSLKTNYYYLLLYYTITALLSVKI